MANSYKWECEVTGKRGSSWLGIATLPCPSPLAGLVVGKWCLWTLLHSFFFFNVYLRQRESKGGRGRQRGRERFPSRLCAVSADRA